MRVLVVSTVHNPRDARVSEREIAALLEAGHEVTQVGPFSAFAVEPVLGVRAIDIPRSAGRRRAKAIRAARAVLRREAPLHDVVLLHAPEALLTVVGLDHPCVVWDVHEDTAAALTMKPWLPRPLARPTAFVVRRAERWAERRARLLLAEDAYAQRFTQRHPIVPNSPVVPSSVAATGMGRAVYLGTITAARGAHELIRVGKALAEQGDARLELIGSAGPEVIDRVREADSRGWLTWRGFQPNDVALAAVEGATVGLSLLHDEPNYRHSRPTKLLEYLARGIPFITTPLPLAVDTASRSGGGIVVDFGDVTETVRMIHELDSDTGRRQSMADSGYAWVREHADWRRDGPEFVSQLQEWAAISRR
jgi:glycosyltransferase involved in cell wall biosynthesis